MKGTITSEILVSYSQCPRKAYLLLCTDQKRTPKEYMNILQRRKEALQRDYIKELKQSNPDVQSYSTDSFRNGCKLLVNATLKAEGIEAECAILRKVDSSSALGKYSYEPTLFIGTYRIDRYQRLELFFIGYVLKEIQSKPPAAGRIISMDGKSHRVKLEDISRSLMPLLEPLQEWTEVSSPEPPPLILKRYCVYCRFQTMCEEQAEKEDNLSLLDGVSTPRAMRKYEKKGIFTVEQLSYLFRPRKRRKRARKPNIMHNPELQALAIRTGKIYLQELPELTRTPIELFLDIEGIPDQGFYYLIGILLCTENACTYHSFWAGTMQDEGDIWQQFLQQAKQHPNAFIYHYGSYERKAISKMAKRYGTDNEVLAKRLVDISDYIYGKIYFPVRSNSLKNIGKYTGASWSSSNASGLQSLIWRHCWEKTKNAEYRELLVTYNEEDCQALKSLTDKLGTIGASADLMSEVDFADQPKMCTTDFGEAIHSEFEAAIKSASLGYERNRISFRQLHRKRSSDGSKERYKSGARGLHQKQLDTKRQATRVIQVPEVRTCPECEYEPLQLMRGATKVVSERYIIDLLPTKNGIRKTITGYVGTHGYCPNCQKFYAPPEIRKYGAGQIYGYGFRAWVVYHRVALRLPYESILESLEEHFGEKLSAATIPYFIKECAAHYAETEELITRHLLDSPFIHTDETQMIVKGANWYAWVFTNGEHVLFKLRESRETAFVHEFLTDYQGILVSDFYSGYDSMPCRQQKCWVHLLRDINNDLQEAPFDEEFEIFVMRLRNLIIPIIDTIQRYGSKKQKLDRFRWQVAGFYQRMINSQHRKSELVIKYQRRFMRYRESLFTFLEEDGIPWNNNAAERAIIHVAKQRDLSRVSLSRSATESYLVLLGFRQTCRFQGKSFFKFLFSEEKDVDKFK